MTPITISYLNFTTRNMIKLSNVSNVSKSFISYTALRNSHTELDYYSNHKLHNKPIESNISNNAGGKVENSEMKFVENSANSNTSVSDDEHGFVPKISSNDDSISGFGHSKV